VKTKEIIPLNTEGFFVGVFKDTKFEEREVLLESGDRILFYTDGITEAKNAQMEEFGEERLKKIYLDEATSDISPLIEKIRNEVFKFAEENIEDDITIAIIEIE
jgi:sigma-B regulation protein RsbU (phosphoserine phosphatase)